MTGVSLTQGRRKVDGKLEILEVYKGLLIEVLVSEIPGLSGPELLTDKILRSMGSSPRGRGFDTGGRLDIALVLRDELWKRSRSGGLNPNEAEIRAWDLSKVVIETLIGKPYAVEEPVKEAA